jgi:hypothetical protein
VTDGSPHGTSAAGDTPRISADADILVRPKHLRYLLPALKQYGWQQHTHFNSRGVVEHSVDFRHNELGQADVHCRFPGIHLPPDIAFERLWVNRSTVEIAHRPCTVPSAATLRLLLLLHAARSGGARDEDVRLAWDRATASQRAEILAVAQNLHAEVPLAIATGMKGEYADNREYDLWRILESGGAGLPSTVAALVKSAPDATGRVRTAFNLLPWLVHLLRSKSDRMKSEFGRKPTGAEIFRAHASSLRAIAIDLRDFRNGGARNE